MAPQRPLEMVKNSGKISVPAALNNRLPPTTTSPSNYIMLTVLFEAEGLPRGFEVFLWSLCPHLCVGFFRTYFLTGFFPLMAFPSVHIGML